MIALECDVALVELRKKRHPAKFAHRHALFEIVAAEDVIEVFHTVDLVLAFLRTNKQAHMIPFASRFGGIDRFARFRVVRRLIKRVQPAAALRVFSFRIVLQLELGAGRPS